MKEKLRNLYSVLLRFFSSNKHYKLKSSYHVNYPKVGFLAGENLREFERKIGIKVVHKELYEQALLHRSYLQVLSDTSVLSNERLEFLGDSVLGVLIADYLFSTNSKIFEGELTKMRSWLVNKQTLAFCARKLNLDKFIKMSYSAEKSLKSGSVSILADALEAVIAAIYLDSGYEKVRKFVFDTLIPIMMNKSIMSDKNYKSLLLELSQSKGKSSPNYEVIEEKGPDHDKTFTVAVFIDNEHYGTGRGRSKKQAEQNAALMALENPLFENMVELTENKNIE